MNLKLICLQSNSFNLILVVADETEVNSVFIGNSPKRKKENETKGQVITPGWKIENQWLRMKKKIPNLLLVLKKTVSFLIQIIAFQKALSQII